MRHVFERQDWMIRTKEVRERLRISAYQIHLYRKAGLFPYDPIAVSYGGLWRDRVYPEEALTHLEVLEGLRERGFGLKTTLVLFLTMAIAEGTKDFISFNDKARMVIAPERLAEAKAIIEAVVKTYPLSYNIPPRGGRPFGKG
ncbi:hypothetical protein ES708_28664 [subsurface metagenome]